jgi:ribosome-associated protein
MVVKANPPVWTPAKPDKPPSAEQSDGDVLQSRSQAKRDAQNVKSLASDLIKLNPSQLKLLTLDDDVLMAISDTKKMRTHGAKRRQLLYLAKMLRRSDVDIIVEELERIQSGADEVTASYHSLETWRAALMEQGDTALSVLIQAHPQVDSQALRQLIRQAKREKAAEKPPAAARKLFRYLRDLNEQQTLPPPP